MVDEICLRVRQRTIRSNVIVTLGLQFSFSYEGWLQPRIVIQPYFDQVDGMVHCELGLEVIEEVT
mgnify:CR=1 FL=1